MQYQDEFIALNKFTMAKNEFKFWLRKKMQIETNTTVIQNKKACFVSSAQTMETSYSNYFTHVLEYPHKRLPTLNV